jgi:hypothetical protein
MIGKPEFIVDERVVWTSLSRNKNAVHILKENIDKCKKILVEINKVFE